LPRCLSELILGHLELKEDFQMTRPTTRLPRIFLMLLTGSWLGLIAPQTLTAAQLAPLGPEVQLASGDSPEMVVVAAQPAGNYVTLWNELPARVFLLHVEAGAEPANEGPAPVFTGATPKVDAITATATGFEAQWHVLNSREEPVAFYKRHLDLHGTPDARRPVLLARGGVDWVWNLGGPEFLAGWTLPTKHAIAARRVTSSGRQTGPELRLNSRAVDIPDPAVVPLAGGGFAAVWYGEITLGEGEDFTLKVLRARLFSAAGRPLGPDFDVNTLRPGTGETVPTLRPEFRVAAAPGGGFAVAWTLGSTIYLRSFDAAGHAASPEIPAVTEEGAFVPASMAFDDQGKLALLWLQFLDHSDLRLQLFDPHGAPLGASVAVRSAASDLFEAPRQGSVTWAKDSWLVAWVADAPGQDQRGVFVRRFVER
jgi:hypothetical protein